MAGPWTGPGRELGAQSTSPLREAGTQLPELLCLSGSALTGRWNQEQNWNSNSGCFGILVSRRCHLNLWPNSCPEEIFYEAVIYRNISYCLFSFAYVLSISGITNFLVELWNHHLFYWPHPVPLASIMTFPELLLKFMICMWTNITLILFSS